jgi:hypothetical protein
VKSLIDVVAHRGDVTLTPLITHEKDTAAPFSITIDLYPHPAKGEEWRAIEVTFYRNRYGSIVFLFRNDGYSVCTTSFTAVRDGDWHEIKFLRDGEIWIIEYRFRVEAEQLLTADEQRLVDKYHAKDKTS